MIELYWINKSLIAQVVEGKGEKQETIIKDLNPLHTMFDAVSKIVFNLQTVVLDHKATYQQEPIATQEHNSTLEDISSNPIRLDEEDEDLIEIHKEYPPSQFSEL
jgi:hypothetical protein